MFIHIFDRFEKFSFFVLHRARFWWPDRLLGWKMSQEFSEYPIINSSDLYSNPVLLWCSRPQNPLVSLLKLTRKKTWSCILTFGRYLVASNTLPSNRCWLIRLKSVKKPETTDISEVDLCLNGYVDPPPRGVGGSISKYPDLSDLLKKKYGLKENISFAGAGT